MIKYMAAAGALVATLAAGKGCQAPDNNHHGANAATQRTCDDIGSAGKGDQLQQRGWQTQIKLDAAKSGVDTGVREAVDAYYGPGGFTGANVTRLYAACETAGAPQSTS